MINKEAMKEALMSLKKEMLRSMFQEKPEPKLEKVEEKEEQEEEKVPEMDAFERMLQEDNKREVERKERFERHRPKADIIASLDIARPEIKKPIKKK